LMSKVLLIGNFSIMSMKAYVSKVTKLSMCLNGLE
jgi:hypothetical protein